MSKCPYTNFKDKILKYIGILRTPRAEYGGMPACPFVGPEMDKGKLMIDMFDPNKITLLEKVKELDESEYDSALFVQVTDDMISGDDTYTYQNFINNYNRKYKTIHKVIKVFPHKSRNVYSFNVSKNKIKKN